MMKKRVRFDALDVPIPKGYERITDKDETTDYLFVNAPKDIYTLYFDSGMPQYDHSVLTGCEESGTMTLMLPDRRIFFYCPSRLEDINTGRLYFNIEFQGDNDEILFLPGQLLVNSNKVYRKIEKGSLPFINILKKINLKASTENTVAVSV